MKLAFIVTACALALAGCQSTGSKPNRLTNEQMETPVRPGETRLSLKNPDPDKWVGRGADSLNAARTLYVCKPLACAAPAILVYTRLNSPTRKPDREALLKLGTSDTARSQAEGWTLVTPTQIGTHKGFPSISHVIRKENNGKMEYSHYTAVFSGGLAFSMSSRSTDNETAKRNLAQFLNAIVIKDGGPAVAAQQ
jgi:hypothetical protein